MYKREAEEFSNYEVYYYPEEGRCETICLCNDREMAGIIAKALAMTCKKQGLKVYVTGVTNPGDFVPGGGWYDCYWRDENGKLKQCGLS